MKKIIIAVDGTAASGKGTISEKLAEYFDFSYLDTGGLFRASALIDPDLKFIFDLSSDAFFKKIKNLSYEELRSQKTGMLASKIATNSDLRNKIKVFEREFAFNAEKGAVLDGRDIGSVVLPNADAKLFVTADVKMRAKRRFEVLKLTDESLTYEKVLEDLKTRDIQDSTRKDAPLKFNESYVLIDTTNDTIEQSIKKAIKAIEQSIGSI